MHKHSYCEEKMHNILHTQTRNPTISDGFQHRGAYERWTQKSYPANSVWTQTNHASWFPDRLLLCFLYILKKFRIIQSGFVVRMLIHRMLHVVNVCNTTMHIPVNHIVGGRVVNDIEKQHDNSCLGAYSWKSAI